ncbi:MAG TPA: CHAT domain-containing protein [Actinomycetota bacterium]|nr:CHAT domain-containing protein [Actinomycetota bacterium]
MEVTYLDFDLLVERSGDGYRSRVIQSPGGQASATFSPPFSQVEVENLVLKVSRSIGQRNVRRVESSELTNVQTFGSRLFDAVFDGDVRACLRSSIDEASRHDAGLRIRLRLGDVPELIDLPWEYLYNSSLNRFIARQLETPLVRYLDLPESIRPLTVQPPVRVLVMISSPTDYAELDVEHEWSKLHDSLADLESKGLVSLERQDDATLPALQQRLRRGQHHVFHFVGHGGFDESMNDGVLVLEDESGKGDLVSGSHLGEMLRGSRPMRLAVLNACEGARNGTTDPFAGAAQSMVQQGIPAVIAMQFEITDGAAIVLAQAFYAALADGYPVDAALGEARRAIFAGGNELEWATPVLYMRSPDGRIFDIAPPVHMEPPEVKADVATEPAAIEEPTPVPEDVVARPTPAPDVPIVDIPLATVVRPLENPMQPIQMPPRRDTTAPPVRPADEGVRSKKRPRRWWIWIAVGAAVLLFGSAPFWAIEDAPPDVTPPTVKLDGPEGTTAETTATITIAINDPTALVECTLNHFPLPCTPPQVTLSDLSGKQIFRVHAEDQAGNESPTARLQWFVQPIASVPTNAALPAFGCNTQTGLCGVVSQGLWSGPEPVTGFQFFWLQNCDPAGTPDACDETPFTGPEVGILCGFIRLGVIAQSAAGDSAPAFSVPQQFVPECIE